MILVKERWLEHDANLLQSDIMTMPVMILACDKSSEVCLCVGYFVESGPTGMLMDRFH